MHYIFNLGIALYEVSNKYGTKEAIRYPDGKSYSFNEVNKISNQLSRYLIKNNIGNGNVVAIFNEKSIYGYSLMLACLKIGAVYTNLDVTSPWSRIKRILDTCVPKAIFFDKESTEIEKNAKEELKDCIIQNFSEIEDRFKELAEDTLSETFNIHGASPAYIMFTSGSTGFPKGAVMSHNNVLNFIKWGKSTFNIVDEDIFTNANPIYFDNSVFDFYISIFNGATVVSLSHELVKNPTDLVKAINSSKCTIWFSVPSLLVYLLTTKALKAEDFKTISRISFGGEGFPKNRLKELYDMMGHRITLFNVYGPTECTCICSSYIISSNDFENMNELAPLGNIAPNFGYEILPLSVTDINVGELCLVGPCVGLGYYNDKNRTEASFVQNEKSHYNQIMYKTGDLVQRTSNGYLHFKGRIDNQIKHMGFRVELEEIEAAFNSLDLINECGVIYEKINSDLGQIKAFVSVSDKKIDKDMIIGEIKKLLPQYMIPRSIVFMDFLPKNSNGKVDRKQLGLL
jgi:D-alanine--poly(phosphoribitol) ligase subunit 1